MISYLTIWDQSNILNGVMGCTNYVYISLDSNDREIRI